ncbi:YbdD/YjiX family protein [uncultured Massilia sp.]|uniref:YbdD/YjiX family protein n=1 Tax=uncultured Massilia sp. TaxID=169973 RepID=UPI0025D7A61C|nr:YbdD/YjiX family protein [uncultured Massilia sp.]
MFGALVQAGETLAQAGRYLGQSMRLMVGLPEYDTYVAHMEKTHPGQPMMSYEEFFRERQEARYGASGNGKCC